MAMCADGFNVSLNGYVDGSCIQQRKVQLRLLSGESDSSISSFASLSRRAMSHSAAEIMIDCCNQIIEILIGQRDVCFQSVEILIGASDLRFQSGEVLFCANLRIDKSVDLGIRLGETGVGHLS